MNSAAKSGPARRRDRAARLPLRSVASGRDSVPARDRDPAVAFEHRAAGGIHAFREPTRDRSFSDSPADRDEHGKSLSAESLDRRLAVLAGRDAYGRFIQGTLARSFLAHQAWRRLGFARLSDYTRERLGVCGRTLEEDARIAGALENLPHMTSAFLGGTLSWSQLRLLTRVARLHNEKEWIRKAAGHGMRELEELVGSAPHDTRDTGADAGDDKPTVPWSVRVSREARRLWRAAVELAGRSAGEPLSAARALELLAAEAAGSEAARRPGATPAFSGDAAVLEWLSVPRHRDPVFERDGWRCTVPACSSRRNLHDHHVEFRSHGGGNGQGNRVTVCAAHHLHGIHTGRIRAAGTAPHAIVWEMPFGRLLGDRYQRTS